LCASKIGIGISSSVSLVHALGDVRRLLVDRVDHRTGVVVKAVFGVGVADVFDRVARDARDIDVGFGRDLARDHDQAGVNERLAGDSPGGVVAHHRVENSVRNLVGDLVRVTLRDRFRGEQELVVCESCHLI
jgi:hypothetical protein